MSYTFNLVAINFNVIFNGKGPESTDATFTACTAPPPQQLEFSHCLLNNLDNCQLYL